MNEYVVLLRGINVGGVRIKMDALRQTLEQAGFEEVRTLLASGNVLLKSSSAESREVKDQAEVALRQAFGYEAWVVVTVPALLRQIVEAFPFDEHHDQMQPYVIFASEPDALDELAALAPELNADEERVEPGPGVLYWEVARGKSTRSLLAKASAKARYASVLTTRNMRTLRKILAKTSG
ncbi:pyridoxamine 5-phosphate oxidase [Lujinxingia litoralis]|uniref:Pyridoxamine 5-phosphate oxidase n=2 Tax=Lujinxingia litoralis TaxID=2211119 RepID=A0A328CEV6_9DELT|nr:pyridoxamine 5-phosphate oxidase [Lujinxingia litoralis]